MTGGAEEAGDVAALAAEASGPVTVPDICIILSNGKYNKLDPCRESTMTLVTLL